MKFTILSLFPAMFAPLNESIILRAQKSGVIEIEIVNFRDFSDCLHKKVDDKPYGGGEGMLLTCQPIYDCIQKIDPKHEAHRIYLDPKGEIFNEKKAKELSKNDHIILLCGHYEGVDERVLELCFDERLSIGDYVLTGGEIPAMVVVDAVSRLVPNVLSGGANFIEESHYDGFLEEPQYTRPQEFMGKKVPDVLVSGDHKKIAQWQKNNRKQI